MRRGSFQGLTFKTHIKQNQILVEDPCTEFALNEVEGVGMTRKFGLAFDNWIPAYARMTKNIAWPLKPLQP